MSWDTETLRHAKNLSQHKSLPHRHFLVFHSMCEIQDRGLSENYKKMHFTHTHPLHPRLHPPAQHGRRPTSVVFRSLPHPSVGGCVTLSPLPLPRSAHVERPYAVTQALGFAADHHQKELRHERNTFSE
jgi:hypothetical protein